MLAGGVKRQLRFQRLGAIADAAVGDHGGDAADLQPLDQNIADHGDVGAAAAVDHQHAAGRRLLDGDARRIIGAAQHLRRG